MMENNVILKFASGSEYNGLEVRLPFTCRFCSGIQDMSSSDYNEEDCNNSEGDYEDSNGDKRYDYDGILVDTIEDGDEMYKMNVSRAVKQSSLGNLKPSSDELIRSTETQVLLTGKYSPSVTVRVGDEIVVSTYFETRLSFGLAIEKCWLSDHIAADTRTISDDDWLVYEGCPPGIANGGSANFNNVTMLPTLSEESGPSFSFKITHWHAQKKRKIYIKCLMGLCSSMNVGTGNIGTVSIPCYTYWLYYRLNITPYHILHRAIFIYETIIL